MTGYLVRLLKSLGAYQLADVVSKLLAVLLLPLYTRHVTAQGYGEVEVFATSVIFASIVVRFGMIEAFLRYHFVDQAPEARDALARRTTLFLLVSSSVTVVPLVVFAGPLSTLLLSHRDTGGFLIAVLGLWAFTNLELAYGLLRVEEKLRAYAFASVTNVVLTIGGSLVLVVGAGKGAHGLMLANYGATLVVLAGVWFLQRGRLLRTGGVPKRFAELLQFGLPTVPAEASVYALSVLDRIYIVHERSLRLAGLYSIGLKFAGGVALIVRAFQYAWPPLAYSVRDDEEASRLYGLITTYYLLVTGWIVAAVALLGRWILRLLTTPSYYGAHQALAWVCLGWALYGLWVVFLAIAGRAKVTTRNLAASLIGLAANAVLLVLLVGPLGLVGAGIALCGAYVAMLSAMYYLTRGLFRVEFEWGRLFQLVVVYGGCAAVGELVLPTHGALGLLARVIVVLAIPLIFHLIGFANSSELAQARRLLTRARAFVAQRGASA